MTVSWDDLIRDAGDAAKTFEPIPEGDYDFEVVDVKAEMTKDGKKKKYNMKAKVVGGAHNGRFVWDNIVLTTDNPNALGFFFRKMASMGLDSEYFRTQRPTDEQIVATMKGRRFRAKIGHRMYNGEKKTEIKSYFPAASGAAGGGLPPSVQGAVAPPAPAPQAAPPAPAPAPAPAPQAAPPAPAPAQDPWTGQPVAQPAAPQQPVYEQPAAPAAPAAPAPAPEQPAAPAPAPAPVPEAAPAPAPAPEPQAAPEAAAPSTPPPPPAAPF